MNNAAMNILPCVFWWTQHSFLLGICTAVELLGYKVYAYSLGLVGTVSFQVVVSIYTPSTSM